MKLFNFFLGLAVSLLFIFVLFSQINWQGFLAAFALANYFYLVPVIALAYLGCYLRAIRWHYLFLPIKRISAYDLFVATILGYAANGLFPARLGEFLRAHYIGKKAGVSRLTSFATIVVERLFDGFSILVILVLVVFLIKFPVQRVLVSAGLAALGLYCLVIVLILLLAKKPGVLLKFVPGFLRPKVASLAQAAVAGFTIIKNGHHLLIIIFYSFFIWLVTAYGVNLTFLAFGQSLPFLAGLFILVLLSFAVMLPSSPGFVGTFEAGMVYGLMVFSVPKEAALGIALVYHGLTFFPVMALGGYYFWRYNSLLVREKRI